MIKIRLNMIETKCNYKGNFRNNTKCDICKLEEDTTEHIFKCVKILNDAEHLDKDDIIEANHKIVHASNRVMEKIKELGHYISLGDP